MNKNKIRKRKLVNKEKRQSISLGPKIETFESFISYKIETDPITPKTVNKFFEGVLSLTDCYITTLKKIIPHLQRNEFFHETVKSIDETNLEKSLTNFYNQLTNKIYESFDLQFKKIYDHIRINCGKNRELRTYVNELYKNWAKGELIKLEEKDESYITVHYVDDLIEFKEEDKGNFNPRKGDKTGNIVIKDVKNNAADKKISVKEESKKEEKAIKFENDGVKVSLGNNKFKSEAFYENINGEEVKIKPEFLARFHNLKKEIEKAAIEEKKRRYTYDPKNYPKEKLDFEFENLVKEMSEFEKWAKQKDFLEDMGSRKAEMKDIIFEEIDEEGKEFITRDPYNLEEDFNLKIAECVNFKISNFNPKINSEKSL